MKNFLRIALVSLLALTSMVAIAAPANAAPHRVGLFNLTEKPVFKPNRFFLSANAGPYLKKLDWTGWGKPKSVGRGRFISDCSSCGEKENKPVTMTVSKLKHCPGYNVSTYMHVKIHVIDPERRRVQNMNFICPKR